jgi:hypothetical protein
MTDQVPESTLKQATPLRRDKSIWRDPKVVVAIIGAVSAITVALWQFRSPIRNDRFSLSGRVYAQDNPGIEGATLTLLLPGEAPVSKPSRSQGHFLFSELPGLAGTLTISANGYVTQTLDITKDSATQNLEIKLVPSSTSPSIEKPAPVQNQADHLTALYSALTSDLDANFGVGWSRVEFRSRTTETFRSPKVHDCEMSWRDVTEVDGSPQAADTAEVSVDLAQLTQQSVAVRAADYGYRFILTSPNPGPILRVYPKAPGALEAKPMWVEFRLSRYEDRILSKLQEVISICGGLRGHS